MNVMAKEKTKKRGGARVGSGSPPLPEGEKKVPITIFVKKKYVDAVGSKAAIKEVAESASERAGRKAKNKFFIPIGVFN